MTLKYLWIQYTVPHDPQKNTLKIFIRLLPYFTCVEMITFNFGVKSISKYAWALKHVHVYTMFMSSVDPCIPI